MVVARVAQTCSSLEAQESEKSPPPTAPSLRGPHLFYQKKTFHEDAENRAATFLFLIFFNPKFLNAEFL